MTDRRRFLALAGLATAGLLLPRRAFAFAPAMKIPITVYKSPTCGCCHLWVQTLQGTGLVPNVIDVADQSRLDEIKNTAGIPQALRSCHTALVGTYAVEGHVPADLILKMLREKPAGRGLAVPGMVSGSPGMDTPGAPHDRYDVLLFQRTGATTVYASR